MPLTFFIKKNKGHFFPEGAPTEVHLSCWAAECIMAEQTLCSFQHKHSLSKYLLSTYCVPDRVTENHSTESGVELH